MRIALATIAGILLLPLALIFLFFMANVTGLPLCSDFAPEADECLAATSAERAAGIAAGWAATIGSAVAVALGIRWAAAGRGALAFVLTALAAPLLAITTIFLIPVEF